MKKAIAYIPVILCLLLVGSSPGQHIEYIGSYDTPGCAYDVFVDGGYAYIADGDSLQIVDVTDPSTPTFAASLQMPSNYATDIYVCDSHAYVIDGDSLQIADISVPSNPSSCGSYCLPGLATCVHVSDNYAYIGWINGFFEITWGALEILDISDPENPDSVGSYGTDAVSSVYISESYAFIGFTDAFQMGDLYMVDISDPQRPRTLGVHDSYFAPSAISAADNFAYVAEGDILEVIDISDPPGIDSIGSYNAYPDMLLDLFLKDGYAYVVWCYTGFPVESGLCIVNVSIPESPFLVCGYETPGDSRAVFVDGDYIYVADSDSLIILSFIPETGIEGEFDWGKSMSIFKNYPNPFNASTAISYSLPEKSDVSISIYNLIGQHVAALREGAQEAGEHTVVWNAENFPSGIYFARLEAARRTENIKMVLLK